MPGGLHQENIVYPWIGDGLGDETIVDGSEYSDAEACWIAPERHELHWEKFGEQYAVYDDRSGDTHLLAEPSARVLQRLLAESGTVSEVTEALCNESGERCDEHARESNSRLLRQLYSVGLIEKVRT